MKIQRGRPLIFMPFRSPPACLIGFFTQTTDSTKHSVFCRYAIIFLPKRNKNDAFSLKIKQQIGADFGEKDNDEKHSSANKPA